MPTDDIAALVKSLDLPAKVRLLTGASAFSLAADPSIGLGEMGFSDGPPGARPASPAARPASPAGESGRRRRFATDSERQATPDVDRAATTPTAMIDHPRRSPTHSPSYSTPPPRPPPFTQPHSSPRRGPNDFALRTDTRSSAYLDAPLTQRHPRSGRDSGISSTPTSIFAVQLAGAYR
jgi:hypothetical protein